MSHSSLLGAFIAPDAVATRDAIHTPIAPFTAAATLTPGRPFRLNDAGNAVSCQREEAIGIVDPFLPIAASKGDRFYGLMLPGLVTKLRHEWDCAAIPTTPVAPAVATPQPEDPEITKLRDYMKDRGVDADTVIKGADYAANDECRGCY
jgi:hypothetical protein